MYNNEEKKKALELAKKKVEDLSTKLTSGRFYEVAYQCYMNLKEISELFSGEANGVDRMIELATLSKKVPMEEGYFKTEIKKIQVELLRLQSLSEPFKNDCKHTWLLKKVNSGWTGSWVDVICAYCNSEASLDYESFTRPEYEKLHKLYADKITVKREGCSPYPNDWLLEKCMPKSRKEVL